VTKWSERSRRPRSSAEGSRRAYGRQEHGRPALVRPIAEVRSAKMASGLRAFEQEYYWMDSLKLDGRGTLCVNICLPLFIFVWLHVMGAFMLAA
jgi:hypothetical protein